MQKIPVTIQILKNSNIFNKLTHFWYFFILALAFFVFALLTIVSFLSTAVIDIHTRSRERIVYVFDNVWMNILVLLVAFGIFLFIEKYGQKIIERVNLKLVFTVVAVFGTVLGMIWVFSVNFIPRADSGRIVAAATDVVAGNYEILRDDYFKLFPFQLGYVAILEIMVRIVGAGNYGTLGAINVILLVTAYGAITLITDSIFRNKKITFYCIILLGLCFQPILFCTFIYGNIFSLAASMWAVFFVIQLVYTQKKRFGILTCLMLALAVVAKPNSWIIVVAVCIFLFLHILQTRKFRMIIYIILFTLGPIFSTNAIIGMYSTRADVDFGSGTPQTAWLAMGLQLSSRAPGWFNGYTFNILPDNDFDSEEAKNQITTDIQHSIQFFRKNPVYTLLFFSIKATSQWTEPEFQSIWISEVRNVDTPVPDFVESIYKGRGREVLHEYMNQYTQVVYFSFSIGLLFGIIVWIKDKKDDEKSGGIGEAFCLLPLIILGAFLYHLLFEAHSQYSVVYLPMMLPYCAFGITKLTERINKRDM